MRKAPVGMIDMALSISEVLCPMDGDSPGRLSRQASDELSADRCPLFRLKDMGTMLDKRVKRLYICTITTFMMMTPFPVLMALRG